MFSEMVERIQNILFIENKESALTNADTHSSSTSRSKSFAEMDDKADDLS